jgi:YesN/AraC family two-component response regulator
MQSPETSGLAILAAFRSEYPEMRIAVLSGYADDEYAEKAMNFGVSYYFLKPSKAVLLEEALSSMAKELQQQSEKENILINSVAENAETKEEIVLNLKPLAGSTQAAANFIINNVVEYIEKNYAAKMSLQQVAEKVFVSQWHLSKLIARNTGQSFSELLNKVRISNAKKLLKNPALRIWEISEQVGFSDVTHFSRIFRSMENKSANEYRNQFILKTESEI